MDSGEKMLSEMAKLRGMLSYEPESGIFRWLVKRNSHGGKVSIGSVAGSPKDGYTQIIANQRQYRAHRLAWLFQTGGFPPPGYEIDHINGIRSDNRWCNLRLVTRRQNNMNAGISKLNRSGVRGVSWLSRRNKWHARIRVEGKIVLLGDFQRLDDAAAARRQAEEKYFGEFRRK